VPLQPIVGCGSTPAVIWLTSSAATCVSLTVHGAVVLQTLGVIVYAAL
jgi:hypothetical protein